jgi:RNA-directed DNA polymerase
MQTRLIELRRHLQGWVGLVPLKSFYKELDKWLRRRVRDCYWRDWRRLRTRVRNLLQLSFRKREALTHGSSSKGSWVMSSIRAAHMALSMEYLARQGLVSLLAIWTKLASRYRTALVRTHMLGGVAGVPQQSGSQCR